MSVCQYIYILPLNRCCCCCRCLLFNWSTILFWSCSDPSYLDIYLFYLYSVNSCGCYRSWKTHLTGLSSRSVMRWVIPVAVTWRYRNRNWNQPTGWAAAELGDFCSAGYRGPSQSTHYLALFSAVNKSWVRPHTTIIRRLQIGGCLMLTTPNCRVVDMSVSCYC